MGIPFLITSIFPKKQFCFTPNSGFLYCFRFIPRHTREHGYPKRKHKSQKNETDIALKNAPFLEDTFLFQVIRKIDDYVNNLIMSLLEEKKAFPFQLFQLFFQHIPPTLIFIYIFIYYIYN